VAPSIVLGRDPTDQRTSLRTCHIVRALVRSLTMAGKKKITSKGVPVEIQLAFPVKTVTPAALKRELLHMIRTPKFAGMLDEMVANVEKLSQRPAPSARLQAEVTCKGGYSEKGGAYGECSVTFKF
jgi:hypothetical protein